MYIITGGAGFIGSNVISILNNKGYKDIIITDSFKDSIKWKNIIGKEFLDVLHKKDLFPYLEALSPSAKNSIKGIIHLGACSSTTETDFDYLLENNFHYTVKLAEFALENNIRFVYASSAATYGNGEKGYKDSLEEIELLDPLNRYGFSKHMFDLLAKKKGFFEKICGLKFFNVYGPNEHHKTDMWSVPLRAYRQIVEEGKVKLFKSYHPRYKDGEQMRDFVYVKDCADICVWLLESSHINGLFNLGTGKARTWNDLVKAVFDAMGRAVNIEYIDMPEHIRSQYQYFTESDMTKFNALGYPGKLSSIEEGVKDYVVNYLSKNS
jgi:ADP-L-glycero-D-manno-heptose 6-epimerase